MSLKSMIGNDRHQADSGAEVRENGQSDGAIDCPVCYDPVSPVAATSAVRSGPR